MDEMARRKNPVSPLEAMPDWMKDLKGFDQLKFKRFEAGEHGEHEGLLGEATRVGAGAEGEMWRIAIAMPNDIAKAAEKTDPILLLPGLAGAVEQLESRIAEIVRFCRSSGRSWTQIGEALSVSKQAAWERYSGEDE
jgi:hypothetical protein